MNLLHRRIPVGNGQTVAMVVACPTGFTPGAAAAVVLAHGAGSDMHAPFLTAIHEGLAARGFVAVKFNFPYREQGRRVPDRALVLEACYRGVVDAVRNDPALAPPHLVIGGKSLGARMASHLAADGAPIAGLVLLGYPLHPAGRPGQLRTAHLERITVPMLFFAGTRDPLCSVPLLEDAIARLRAPVTLHLIDGGNHSFEVPRAANRPAPVVWNSIIADTTQWLRTLFPG